MSWELREGRRYYYRAVRREGKTHKEYLGKGPAAELAARLDARARQGRERESAALEAEKARRRPAEKVTLDFEEVSELLLSAWMYAAGFHRHRLGPWRMRRGRPSDES